VVPAAAPAPAPAASKEAEGRHPAFNEEFVKGIYRYGEGKNGCVVPTIGNFCICSSHVKELLISEHNVPDTFVKLSDLTVKTDFGPEHLWAYQKPVDKDGRVKKGIPAAPFNASLAGKQAVLSVSGGLFATGIVKSQKDGFIVHDATTAVGDCNTPVMVEGKMVGVHIATRGKGYNLAFPFTGAMFQTLNNLSKKHQGNEKAGEHQ
jgi:hypothetical protein